MKQLYSNKLNKNIDINDINDLIDLWNLYFNREMSLEEIAKDINIGYNTIRKIFKNNKLSTKILTETIVTSKGVIYKNDIAFWNIYYNRYKLGESFDSISSELGMYTTILRKHFKTLKFSLRTKEENKLFTLKNQKKTMLEKYGVENPMYLDNVKDKLTKTMLEKYGVENIFQNEEIKNKIKENNLIKYGVESPMHLKEVKDKLAKTMLERYGVPCIFNTIENKHKAKNTPKNMGNAIKMIYKGTIDRWSSYLEQHSIILLDEFKGVANYTKKDKKIGWTRYKFKCNICEEIFIDTFNGSIRCPICNPKHISSLESKYIEYLKNEKIVKNNYTTISPLQIDLVLPDKNIAFEYNGTYWHSTIHDRININYHKNKTDLCLNKNIKLYHIWEHDNEDIVKSKINQLLGKIENKYFARKLQLKEVNYKERKLFFNDNHLHGDVKSSFTIGLYNGEELVSCISFRKHKEGIEIARFATKLNSIVVGGFTKLLKYAIIKIKSDYKNIEKIITYCDRDWTPDHKDSVYYKNGFNFIKDTGCILRYYSYKNGVEAREKYQKHKLKELFPKEYSDGKTADEILYKSQIYPFYNSGNWKYEMEIK